MLKVRKLFYPPTEDRTVAYASVAEYFMVSCLHAKHDKVEKLLKFSFWMSGHDSEVNMM
jgi:hypothetical protein